MAIEVDVFRMTEGVTDPVFNAAPENDSGIISEFDLVYDESEPETCRLDVFRPAKRDGKSPVLMYVHGGGFVAGDKRHRRGVSSWYASLGLYVFNVNYGLSPKYKFPQPLVHLIRAVNYIAGRADELDLDLSRFLVSGDSAGGYYAAELAAAGHNERVAERLGIKPAAPFAGAVINCGLYDAESILKLRMPFNINGRVYEDFVGVSGDEKSPYDDILSPLALVTPSFPPSFLIFSKKDMFCRGQAEQLIEKLHENRVPCEFYKSDRVIDNHCFPLTWKTPAARKANAMIADFVRRFIDGGRLGSPKDDD